MTNRNTNNKGTFYLTTTLPYVNDKPHLGHALEFVRADIIARHKELNGFQVFLNTGTDEHGIKIYRKALEKKKDTQEYVDEFALIFKDFTKSLGMVHNLNFMRTTDSKHIKAAQEFWKICDKNGDIYKKNYKVKYCVGCELEKTDSELIDGKCPEHTNTEIEIIEEENYFFRFSKYQKPLLDFYKKNPEFIVPNFRFKEIVKFVERGLTDFSISRLKEKMPWGVSVPEDESQVMYVWFDALVNYVSAIGWPFDMEKFNKWWPVTQYCGKDNLRQQSAIWQAMLMSAGLTQSKQIIIDGFILGEGGIKMSKSLGNTVDPMNIISEYGSDVLRFYLAKHINSFEDSEFTKNKFKEAYNADLANGLGNLVSRIMKMAETYLEVNSEELDVSIPKEYNEALRDFDISKATNIIWQNISQLDKEIQETEPFKMVKTNENKAKTVIKNLVVGLNNINLMLQPIMPRTYEIIKNLIINNESPKVPLFARK